jgi:hypothetical protein
MPYDSAFILLAIRFYIGFKLPGLTPAEAHRDDTGEPLAASAAPSPTVIEEKPAEEPAPVVAPAPAAAAEAEDAPAKELEPA